MPLQLGCEKHFGKGLVIFLWGMIKTPSNTFLHVNMDMMVNTFIKNVFNLDLESYLTPVVTVALSKWKIKS